MTPQEKLKEIETRSNEPTIDLTPMSDKRWLIARVKELEAGLNNQKQVVYETLLEATVWMGIPEKNREVFIKDRLKNVQFIIDKVLKGSKPDEK